MSYLALFVFALMTAAAILAVLWPLGRGQVRPRGGNDVAVYRDQIEEVERDRAAGRIGTAEAEAARVEVARRLLAADAARAETAVAPGATLRRRIVALAALLLLPALSAGLYGWLGAPSLPGQASASRPSAAPQDRSLEDLVAQVEAHLERKPDDGRGWEVVAPVYLRLGRFEDAVKARRNALRLNGTTADREADLGEALMAAGNGVVSGEAKAAFERALAHAPKHLKARFFLGIAAQQEGQNAAAAAIWREMLADARPESPWVPTVRQALAQLGGGGPSAEEMAAAEQMSPEDRAAMVRGMVERLAERLKRDGSDLEGWLRLVRAYSVLGERERALAAVADARRALGHDADKLRRLDALVKELRLEG